MTHDPTLRSELDAAWDIQEADPWPLAILEFKAGDALLMLDLIEEFGVPKGSVAAKFLVEILDGTFKPSKRDRGLNRRHTVLSMVDIDRRHLEDWKVEPHLYGGDCGARPFRNMEQVFALVAEDLGMTEAAVEQIVKRNRRRLRSGDNS